MIFSHYYPSRKSVNTPREYVQRPAVICSTYYISPQQVYITVGWL